MNLRRESFAALPRMILFMADLPQVLDVSLAAMCTAARMR